MSARCLALALALVALSIVALPRPGSGEESAEALDAARLPRAFALSRGEGVTVAVLGSGAAPLATIVARAAPAARVLTDEENDAPLDRALASAARRGARVVLVPLALARPPRGGEKAIDDALRAGLLVVAPTGDEGLSHERWPASQRGVVSVAALAPSGELAGGTNAGARTLVAASPGEGGSAESAALVAGAVALALGFDPSLRASEVVTALGAGAPVEASEGRARPARLDALDLLERLRPRSRAIALRGARVVPAFALAGEAARARVTVLAAGRLPSRGVVTVTLASPDGEDAASGAKLLLPFGPLEPGESVELEGEVHPSARAPRPLATPGGGAVAGSTLAAIFRAGDESARASFAVVSPDQRPAALRLLSWEADAGLVVRATVENASVRSEEDAFLRLVVAPGSVVAEEDLPALAPGEQATVVLRGRFSAREGQVSASLELGRRPRAFRESVLARVSLALDSLGAGAPRKVRRR